MTPLRTCLHLGLSACLLTPLMADAWQLRGGGGGRTFVVPYHAGGGHFAPPPPHYQPMPHPMLPHPQPMPPHPAPPPHPQPGPGPHPPGPPPHPPGPGPHPPGPGPMPPPPPPPPPHPDDWYHPWAAAAVVGATTATAIAIGTQVAEVPPDCVSVVANGVAYQHCGATWYQPQYVGSNVQFIVVPAPW